MMCIWGCAQETTNKEQNVVQETKQDSYDISDKIFYLRFISKDENSIIFNNENISDGHFEIKIGTSQVIRIKDFVGEESPYNQKFYNNPVMEIGSESITLKRDFYYDFENPVNLVYVLDDKNYFVLFNVLDPPGVDKWYIIQIENGKKKNEVVLPEGSISDFDDDGKYELGGYRIIEAYCRNCDSAYYNPPVYYELSDGFPFDSIAVQSAAKNMFGQFFGYSQDYNVIVSLSKFKR